MENSNMAKPASLTLDHGSRALYWAEQVAMVVGASLFVALCARVTVPLPFTPVPLTLQNFGVLLVGLTLGSRRGFAALALYLFYLVVETLNTLAVYSMADRYTRSRIDRCAAAVLLMPAYRFLVFHFRFSGFLVTLKDPQGPNLALIAQVGAGGELQEVQRVPGMLARFSPDGRRVLVSSVPGTEIAILDLKTGEQQVVPRVTNANRNHAAWCLDGKHILYHTYPQADTPSRPLSLHALPEAEAKPHETLRLLVENGARNELPRVAPDDGAVAYIAAKGPRKTACLADAQGRYCVALLDAQAAVWAPDGRTLYVNDRQGRLVALRFGGLAQPLRLTPAYAAGQGPLTGVRVESRAQAETKLHLALLAYDADSRLIQVVRDAGGTPSLAPGGKVDVPVELGEAAPNAVTLKAVAYGEGVPMVIRLFPVRQP
jgi:hypothetical protein